MKKEISHDMPTVLVEHPRAGTALVTLNRPQSLNSFNLQTVYELDAILSSLATDDSCRVVVLTGAGRGFCSGHELAEMRNSGELVSPVEAMAVQQAFAALTVRVRTMPQPVVAAVNGPAAGAGLALALASDIRICSESAKFNAAFVRIGLSGCDVGVSYLLPRIVGPTLAFEMMLTGRLVGADEALRSGLVLRVVPGSEVVPAAFAVAESICANSPFGVRMTKEVMWANLDAPSLQSAIDMENRTQVLCVQTRDMQEAIAAFVDKRPPVFTNS